MKKSNLLVLILLSIVTLGNYAPIWYLRRREAFNALRTRERLGGVGPTILLLVSIGFLVYSFGFGEAVQHTHFYLGRRIELAATLFNLVIWPIVLLWYGIGVKRILDEHLRATGNDRVRLSGLGVFFFNFLYLQYKINRIITTSEANASMT
ncbi:MAG TPA: DUF4234 domain-containing protein [Pantanalinema sp.]